MPGVGAVVMGVCACMKGRDAGMSYSCLLAWTYWCTCVWEGASVRPCCVHTKTNAHTYACCPLLPSRLTSMFAAVNDACEEELGGGGGEAPSSLVPLGERAGEGWWCSRRPASRQEAICVCVKEVGMSVDLSSPTASHPFRHTSLHNHHTHLVQQVLQVLIGPHGAAAERRGRRGRGRDDPDDKVADDTARRVVIACSGLQIGGAGWGGGGCNARGEHKVEVVPLGAEEEGAGGLALEEGFGLRAAEEAVGVCMSVGGEKG